MKTKHGGLNNQDANIEIVKNLSTVETDLKKICQGWVSCSRPCQESRL